MISGGLTRTSSTASSRMTWIRRGSASSPASSRACSRRLDVGEGDHASLDLRDRLLRDDDDVAVLELDALGDERREIVSLAQLGHSLDG